jgi:hypothetical protein
VTCVIAGSWCCRLILTSPMCGQSLVRLRGVGGGGVGVAGDAVWCVYGRGRRCARCDELTLQVSARDL